MRVVSALAFLVLLSAPVVHAQAAYQAALIGDNEVPAVTTPADGIAKVFIDGTTITVSGSFTGLTSEYVASHIHRGAAGENGPVALTLTAGLSLDKTEGSWEFANNTFTVTQALADSIANGLTYVNVHTTSNPAGEIRGQIVTSARTADALIVGVFDGPLTGGQPKAIELHFRGDVPDLSRYAVGSANNGDGSDGPELVLPAGPIALGTFYTIADNAADFTTYFGVAPDIEDGVAAINGDDAIELYYDADDNGNFARTEVVDVFGEIDVDGTGQVWEYTDGWAYRQSGTNPGGDIFFSNAWTYSGIDANDGKATNVDPNAFPIGTYSPIAVDPTARLQVIHNAADPAADTVDI
ncbi:MAG: CHRD domain-containing protein [Bacteroidota bacterium]